MRIRMWLLAVVLLLPALLATEGTPLTTKVIQELSLPFVVDPNKTYVEAGAVQADANSVADYEDAILWYDGTGNGTQGETATDTTVVKSGTATTAFAANAWREQVTPPVTTPPIKYARRRAKGTITTGGNHKLYWGPFSWEEAPDKYSIKPANVLASHMDLGVPAALYNGDMEIPNLTGTLPDAYDATGTYSYTTPPTADYSGVKMVILGGAVGTHTLLSPYFVWVHPSETTNPAYSLFLQSEVSSTTLGTATMKVRFFTADKVQTGSDVTPLRVDSGGAYAVADEFEQAQVYVPYTDVPTDAVYARVVYTLITASTGDYLYVDGLLADYANRYLHSASFRLTDAAGRVRSTTQWASPYWVFSTGIKANGVVESVDVGSGGGFKFPSGAIITNHYTATAALNFGSIAGGTTAELTITVVGASVGDSTVVTPNGAPEAGLVWGSGYVSAADTVTVRLGNVTTGAIDPASRTWRADVTKH